MKEIHIRGCHGFLKDAFPTLYSKKAFPQLKRLIIDQRDIYGARNPDNYCYVEIWKLICLPQILENLASIEDLQIWSLNMTLEANHSQLVSKNKTEKTF